MEVILNGKLTKQETVLFSPTTNRAFSYGDGVFETMIIRRGTCALLSYHYKRLIQGLEVLEIFPSFNENELEGFIWELSTKFKNSQVLRMRLQVWRKEGGLYTPEKKEGEFLLTASPQQKPDWVKEKAAFSKTVQLSYSTYSSLKTLSALPYVLVGMERKQKELDEILLTDTKGNVAEAGSSNLFWLKDGIWHTPHLQAGCIAGVMRAYLLDQLAKNQIPVQEVLLPKEKLMEAEALVACNVTGIYTIKTLDYHTFDSNGRQKLLPFIQLPEL